MGLQSSLGGQEPAGATLPEGTGDVPPADNEAFLVTYSVLGVGKNGSGLVVVTNSERGVGYVKSVCAKTGSAMVPKNNAVKITFLIIPLEAVTATPTV